MTTQKLTFWLNQNLTCDNSKTPIVRKSNYQCDNSKTQIVSNPKLWENLKTLGQTQFKNLNCKRKKKLQSSKTKPKN